MNSKVQWSLLSGKKFDFPGPHESCAESLAYQTSSEATGKMPLHQLTDRICSDDAALQPHSHILDVCILTPQSSHD